MPNSKLTHCFRLVGCFAGLLALTIVLSLAAMYAIRGLGTSLDTTAHFTARKLALAGEINAGTHEMRVHATMAEISVLSDMLTRLPRRFRRVRRRRLFRLPHP